ncbi:MAG: carboxypeptidase-like regulatory domain-containing protein [Anaerolineae bacterium]
MHQTRRSILIRIGLVGCALIALLMMSWLSPATSTSSLAAGFTPSPPPTSPPQPTSTPEEEREKPKPCPPSAIRGTVTDLCRGEPARGVKVSINGAVVTTDSFGTYSITGLPPGEYYVTVLVDPAWQPSSETVYLNCDQVALVDLTFNSCLPPVPTATEVAPLIPVTGAAPGDQLPAGLVAIAGLVLVLLGITLWTGSRRAR